jgi:hypothetical protein
MQKHFQIVHVAVRVSVFKKFMNSNYIGCMVHTSHLNLLLYIFPAVALYTHFYSQQLHSWFLMLLRGNSLHLKHVGALKTNCAFSWE